MNGTELEHIYIIITVKLTAPPFTTNPDLHRHQDSTCMCATN